MHIGHLCQKHPLTKIAIHLIGQLCLSQTIGVPRIHNGNVVPTDDTYPWTTALMYTVSEVDSQFCGGTLIAPYWVLTAAHCISDEEHDEPDEIFVVLGAVDYTDENAFTSEIDTLYKHPDFDGWQYDVALLKLLSTPQDSSINQLPLIYDSDLCDPGEFGFAIGWGDHDPPPPDEILLYSDDLELLTFNECDAIYLAVPPA